MCKHRSKHWGKGGGGKHQLRPESHRQARPSLLPFMHLPKHGRKHRGGCGGIKHRLWSQPHGYSMPSILLASVQVLNKLDSHQDIRNCNVFYFTETWLSAGIPDSPREDVESLATDISLLGAVDWVMMRFSFGLPHHAGAGKAGEVWGPPAVLRCCAAHRDL